MTKVRPPPTSGSFPPNADASLRPAYDPFVAAWEGESARPGDLGAADVASALTDQASVPDPKAALQIASNSADSAGRSGASRGHALIAAAELRAYDAHVALVYAKECIEHVADERYAADRCVDAEIGQHSRERKLGHAEVPRFPHDVARQQRSSDVTEARYQADDCIDADALPGAGNYERRVQDVGDLLEAPDGGFGRGPAGLEEVEQPISWYGASCHGNLHDITIACG